MRNFFWQFVFWLSVWIYFGSTNKILAQNIVNVESVRPKIDEIGYKGEVKFELNGASGNSKRVNGGVGSSSVWNSGLSQQFVLLNYRYGESQGVKDANESFVHLRHVIPLFPLNFWESYVQSHS